jgi:hypothetical protein
MSLRVANLKRTMFDERGRIWRWRRASPLELRAEKYGDEPNGRAWRPPPTKACFRPDKATAHLALIKRHGIIGPSSQPASAGQATLRKSSSATPISGDR